MVKGRFDKDPGAVRLPKANIDNPPDVQPSARIIAYCPDCGKYIAPGFASYACPFCQADFQGLPEYMEGLAEQMRRSAEVYKWQAEILLKKAEKLEQDIAASVPQKAG